MASAIVPRVVMQAPRVMDRGPRRAENRGLRIDMMVNAAASGSASIPARSGGWPSPTWRAPQGPGPEPRPQTPSNSANNVQKNETRKSRQRKEAYGRISTLIADSTDV